MANSSLLAIMKALLFGTLIGSYIQSYAYYEKSCFPIRAAASHACCAPSAIVRTIGQILLALLDSRGRARIVFHDNKDELIERFSEYGIEKEMLPVELGGTIDLDANGWISQRRSVEMEGID